MSLTFFLFVYNRWNCWCEIVHGIGGVLKGKCSFVMFMCIVKTWLFVGIQVNLKYENKSLLMAMDHLLQKRTLKWPLEAETGTRPRGRGTCGHRCQCRWPYIGTMVTCGCTSPTMQALVAFQVSLELRFDCFCISLTPQGPYTLFGCNCQLMVPFEWP